MSRPYCFSCGVFIGNPIPEKCDTCGTCLGENNIIYTRAFVRPETIADTNEEGKLGRMLKFVKRHFDKKV